MLIPFLPLQNKYPVTPFIFSDFDKKDIDNQKVQVTNTIKRESGNIWYLLTWQLTLDRIMLIPFLPLQNEYPATRNICANFDLKKDIDNQKGTSS